MATGKSHSQLAASEMLADDVEQIVRMVKSACVPMAVVDAARYVVIASSGAFEALVPPGMENSADISLIAALPQVLKLDSMLRFASQGQAGSWVSDTQVTDDGDSSIDTASTAVDRGDHVHGGERGLPVLAQVQWAWAVTPVPDSDGKVIAILLSASDISGSLEVAERIEMLEGLVYLSRRVSSADLTQESLYGLIAGDIASLVGAGACVILRLDQAPSRNPRSRIVRPVLPAFGVDDASIQGASIEIQQGSVAWRIIFEGETFTTRDVTTDPELAEYRDFFARMGARNGVGVPMRVRGRTIALLVVLNKPGGFSEHDVDLMEVFAAESALALENARLFAEEHRVATTLQEALLPGPMPDIPDLDIHAIYRAAGPAGSVGGDFYDVFRMQGDHYGFLLGDVSGKGPEAAAQTALVRHMARGLALKEAFAGPVLAELNKAVWDLNNVENFITILFGVYDCETLTLSWANAGHPAPLHWRRGKEAKEIGAHGMALGIDKHADVRVNRLKLAPGDIVVWYTDGLSEARHPGGEMLGVPALLRTLESMAEQNAKEIAERLYDRAIAHCGRLEDDVAVLVVHRTD